MDGFSQIKLGGRGALTAINLCDYPTKKLIAQDRHDEARGVLVDLQIRPDDNDDFINKEMMEIQHAIDEEREAAHGSSYKALLKNGEQKFFYRTMLGIGGQFMQQVCDFLIWMRSSFQVK